MSLTPEEDDILRRLNYMAKHGFLSERSRERMHELRLRDRRKEIREPREFQTNKPPAKQAGQPASNLRRKLLKIRR